MSMMMTRKNAIYVPIFFVIIVSLIGYLVSRNGASPPRRTWPPSIRPPPDDDDFGRGEVGKDIGPLGVFPRARPRLVHNLLFSSSTCEDKASYVQQWKGDAVVVEVGSYQGEELALFKGLVRKMYTYEPSPAKFEKIRSVISELGMEKVVTFRPAAASDKTGEASFNVVSTEGTQQDSLGDVSFLTKKSSSSKTINVPIVRLDSEIQERVHLLKIDTQGHEIAVVKGAEGIIRKFGIDVIHAEFSPGLMRGHGTKPEAFLEYMWQLGYTCSYCTASFGLQNSELPVASGAQAQPWGWNAFTASFGEVFEIPGHGAWGDLICI